MQAHGLVHLAVRLITDGSVSYQADPRRVARCLAALSPAAVGRKTNLSYLACLAVYAITVGSTKGLGLPRAIARHIDRWCCPGTRLRHRLRRRWLYRARARDLAGPWGAN